MAKHTKIALVKNATVFSAYLLIVWGLYRYLIVLPEELEELVIKPIFWLIPVFLLVRNEGLELSSLGITTNNLFKSIYLSIFLGAIFVIEGLLVNFFKYGGINFAANIGDKVILYSLLLTTATAISEEIAFRGYIFTHFWEGFGSEWLANFLSSGIWTVIHIPITIFYWRMDLTSSLAYLLVTAIFGIGSAYIFARTKNVFSSILLHVLWEWPIILFR